ncbi:MAG: exosortase H, IPTLxxWG-CTERM-specific [Candidatus Nitrotoga sp. CP45]|nr:MAG: exosortase H, IPTLxxWG-CTERM-specific [Candidatus Nitrotoga sp. CP45]
MKKVKKPAPQALRQPSAPISRWGASRIRLAVGRISFVQRFLLIFGATALIGFGIEVIPWVDQHLIKTYIAGIAWMAGNLINLAGGLADVNKAVIQHPVNSFAIMVANGCSGLEAVILLVAGILAFPATLRQRIIGCVAGTMTIVTLNLLRIISLFYLGQYSQKWFDWAHFYAWDNLIMIDALVAFFLWVRWLPPYQGSRHASTPE